MTTYVVPKFLLQQHMELAEQNAKLMDALEVCHRVIGFNLERMITFGPDYNQAVKDAFDISGAALNGDLS
jgi:hypothetical protein